jgi:hypothetical protein
MSGRERRFNALDQQTGRVEVSACSVGLCQPRRRYGRPVSSQYATGRLLA